MKLTRPILDRIQQIHELLQRKRYLNCPALAAELGVTGRTVYRDLDFMRDRLHLPIEFNLLRNGYYYTKPVEKLPTAPQVMSEEELFAILVATKALAPYQGTPWHTPLQRAFRRMIAPLDTRDRVHLQEFEAAFDIRLSGPDELEPQTFKVLAKAILQRCPVGFEYRKFQQRSFEARAIHPYQLACVAHRWYVIGHDLSRNDIRVFVVARIRTPGVLPGRFTRPRDFNAEHYLRGSFGIFRGKADFKVVVELDAWAADVFRGRRWHASQQVREMKDGTLQVSFRLDNLEEIEPWVLGWGGHARVLAPTELRARMARTAAALAAEYGPPSPAPEGTAQPELFPQTHG